jgi:cell division septum initiation protein DivIVA
MSITDEINAISDRVLELEQENESLRQQLDARPDNTQSFDELLKQHEEAIEKLEACDKLIDLVAEDIIWQEKHLADKTSQKMKSIVAAYRAIRPKEGK